MEKTLENLVRVQEWTYSPYFLKLIPDYVYFLYVYIILEIILLKKKEIKKAFSHKKN